MLFVAAAYFLLCLPLRIQVDLCLHNTLLEWHVSVFACGVGVRLDEQVCMRDGKICREGMPVGIRRNRHTCKKPEKATSRIIRTALLTAGKRRTELLVAIGLGDAAATALASGVLLTMLNASLIPALHPAEVCVIPDFEHIHLTAAAHGILETTPGDIIAALLMNRGNRRNKNVKRNGERRWISILLKA